MFFDPVSGRHYGSREEFEEGKAATRAVIANLSESSRRQAEQDRLREESHQEAWGEIEPNRCVLISAAASRKINPSTRTDIGEVCLDGLVQEISGAQAWIRIHYLTKDPHQPQLEMTTSVHRDELELLGHPFTWWRQWNLKHSAVERSHRYGRNDEWNRPSFSQFWEPV